MLILPERSRDGGDANLTNEAYPTKQGPSAALVILVPLKNRDIECKKKGLTVRMWLRAGARKGREEPEG
jgi:hypothetical protein